MANGVALVGSVMIILAFLCQTVFFVGPLWFKNPDQSANPNNYMAGLWYGCESSINECKATALKLESYFKVTGEAQEIRSFILTIFLRFVAKKGFQVFDNCRSVCF